MTVFLNLLHLPIIDLLEIVHILGQECGLGQHRIAAMALSGVFKRYKRHRYPV